MAPYRPFLVPLLESGTRAAPPPASLRNPADEEALLLHLPLARRPAWESLAEKVLQSYGLPLLVQDLAGARCRRPAGTAGTQPWRVLVLEEGGDRAWFVLEHPEALPLHDELATPDQRPALALPSLFARWWARCAPTAEPEAPPAAPGALEDRDSMAALHAHLQHLVTQYNPSDWHLEPKRDHFLSRLRVAGVLGHSTVLSPTRGQWLVQSILAAIGRHGAGPGECVEGRLGLPGAGGELLPLRVSLVPALHGHALTVRFLHATITGLEGLGLDHGQMDWLLARHTEREGLWLVAGPTGSGKSTTLHALLQRCVAGGEKVLAIEDPVERVVPGVQHLGVGQPPGLTFARALRAFLRQGPDTVLVGEIRDSETAAIALQAARSGHRVLSTIHARDNAGVLRRFEDLGQPAHQVMPVCPVLVHQRLVARLCPACAVAAPVPPTLADCIAALGLPEPPSLPHAAGCPKCHAGRSGRLALFSLGGPDPERPVAAELLAAGWRRLCAGQAGLEALLPLAPEALRRCFARCHAGGFC